MTISRSLPESFYCTVGKKKEEKKKQNEVPALASRGRERALFLQGTRNSGNCARTCGKGGSLSKPPPAGGNLHSFPPPALPAELGDEESQRQASAKGPVSWNLASQKGAGVPTTASLASPHEKRGRRGDRRRAFLLFGVIPRLFSFPTFGGFF